MCMPDIRVIYAHAYEGCFFFSFVDVLNQMKQRIFINSAVLFCALLRQEKNKNPSEYWQLFSLFQSMFPF